MHFYTLYYSTLCPDGENGHRRCRDSRFPKTVFTLYVHTDSPMDPNVPRVSTPPRGLPPHGAPCAWRGMASPPMLQQSPVM